MFTQDLPPAITLSIRTLFTTIFILLMCDLFWLITKIQWLFQRSKFIRFLLIFILFSALCGLLALEWFGFHALINYIITNFVISFALLFTAWLCFGIAMIFLNTLNDVNKWQNTLRKFLGIKKNRAITEIVWIKIALTSIIWGTFVIALLSIWVLSKAQQESLLSLIYTGIYISDIEIVPLKILFALFAFPLLSLFTRWLRRTIAIHTQVAQAQGMNHSIATIVGYIGFSLSFLIALLIAGVNLTGLALIAGALSVGIGFGLQNIVNNFVSGLILLIERPIKPGDRVLVGAHEGYVKSISIRSTVIYSLDRMDVILPNSELISGEVTNLMLDDRHYRLQIYIGVGYDSDVDKVFVILHDVAHAHPDVNTETPLNPKILFNKHGDSALEFEMRVIIKDVNRRQLVRSELNTMINKAFRENQITIPYPQRDIHIKQPS